MSKTVYIIIAVVAIIAVITAIYFYNKSKTTTCPSGTTYNATTKTCVPVQANPTTQNGIWNLVNGLTGVLSNVNWQSIFGGNNNQQNLDQLHCGGQGHWNATTQQCEA